VWDSSGKLLAELTGHEYGVNSASFSPDGQHLVTVSDDKTARVWDSSGKLLAELAGHQGGVYIASFSPDGQRIVTASDKTVRVWDSSGKQLAELTGHQGEVTSASFSPDGQRIVTGSWDKTARVWDSSGKLLAEFTGHQGEVWSASFSPDGQRLVTASLDNTARVWRVESLEQLLARGCSWLNDYLITHPKDLETLAECQNKSNLMAAAPFLVKEGEGQATAGNIDEAITTFRKALKWNPNLELDPEAEARRLAAPALARTLARKQVDKAEELIKQGEVEQALAAYAEVQKLDPNLKISRESWNTLCWLGSLHGHAADVIDACEKAVALDPENGGSRDSRGLARALSGNRAGAIEDFEAFVAWSDNEEDRLKRQRWINDLRAGKNPFTPEEIKALLDG
jgi:uncharacterized protein with WD repeat